MKALDVKIQVPDGVEPASVLDGLKSNLRDSFGPECKVVDDSVDLSGLEDETQSAINDRATLKDEERQKDKRYQERLDAKVAQIPDSDLPLHYQYAGAEMKRFLKSQIATDQILKEDGE